MGLVIHRLSGNKQIVNMLHKCNHAISYHDIRTQNLAWSRMMYLEWLGRFETFILPPIEAEPVAVGIINDTYGDDSLKRGTRKERGKSDVRVLIEGFEQHMLQGTKW